MKISKKWFTRYREDTKTLMLRANVVTMVTANLCTSKLKCYGKCS